LTIVSIITGVQLIIFSAVKLIILTHSSEKGTITIYFYLRISASDKKSKFYDQISSKDFLYEKRHKILQLLFCWLMKKCPQASFHSLFFCTDKAVAVVFARTSPYGLGKHCKENLLV